MAIDFTHSKFSPKALDFLANSDARINILHGSVRASKTVNCDIRYLTYMFDGPPGDLVIVGKTVATLQRNVLNDLFDMAGARNWKWVSKQQGELQVFNRRIYCVGANNEDAETKIKGATFAGAYCDEAALYPQGFWMQLMARLSVIDAICLANCNPENPYHWFYTEVINNPAVVNKKVWHFLLEDNPNLGAEYIKALKSEYKGVFYRRYILGEWCIAEGAIYDMFDTAVHLIPMNTVKNLSKVYRYFIGCDYGTSTVMSWSLMADLGSGTYIKVAEYYYNAVTERRQKSDFEFGTEFDNWVRSFPDLTSRGIWAIFIDPSAASWKAELRSRGYKVYDADNDVLNGIRDVASLLALKKYLINENCVQTSREYQSYSWDADWQAKGIDKPLKINDHACDSDRYALHTYRKYRLSGVY